MRRFILLAAVGMMLLTLFPSALEYDVSGELSQYLPDGAHGDTASLAEVVTSGSIVDKLKTAVKDSFPDVFGAFGALVCAVLLSGISSAVSNSLKNEDVSVIAGICVCGVLVFTVIKTSFDVLHTSLTASVSFMTAMMGIMCYVYGIMGNVGGMGLSSSILAVVLQTVQMIASYVLFPLVGTVFGLTLAGCLKEKSELSGISSFVKKSVVFILSACGAALSLALTLGGIFSTVSEGVLKKSVKFAAGSFIPIIGSSLAEAYDAVFSSINAIKATAGAGGIGALLLIYVPPFFTLCVTKLLFSCASALSEMLGLTAQTKLIEGCGDILTVMIGICSFSSAVMIIACAVFMRAGII